MNIVLPKIKTTNNQLLKVYPSSTEFILKFDGCSKGNPGSAGIGAVIYKNGIEYWASCKYLGDKKTNNEAEYSALILGLENAIEQKITKLSVCGDSLLVINQINGVYKVKNENLFKLYEKAIKLKNQFSYIDFNHIYRKDNKRADELSNIALDYINDFETKVLIDCDNNNENEKTCV